jgi:cytochrome c oxidase subunit 2
VGPSWVGLFGSEVDLADGSTIIADRDYLVESIRDPSAERVAGYSVPMPAVSLSDAEIAAIVDYIASLTS